MTKENSQQELAFELYKQGYKYKDIAEEVGCTLSAVKSWATRVWKMKKVAKKSCNQKDKKVAKLQPRGYSKGKNPNSHKNATGPPGNKNAEKHGFFSKILPEETLELVSNIDSFSPVDVLWQNIQIQYAAILRAQKIMYVEGEYDTTKEILSETSGNVDSVSYTIQFAWDKQANFLHAQARAMQTLNNMIKQYDELMKSELATEEQKARIEVLKAKINTVDETVEDDGFIDALSNQAKDDWSDYD